MAKFDGLDSLFEMLGSAISDSQYDKVTIGKISETLRVRFAKMGKEKEMIAREMKTRKEILEAEMELKLYKEFNDRAETHSEEKDACWLAATKELGVSDDGRYSCNFKDGTISEKVPKKNAPDNIFTNPHRKNR
jgi:hypothetical protein